MKKIVSLFTLLLTTLASWAIDDGVPHALAQQRSREITNVSYPVSYTHLTLPTT